MPPPTQDERLECPRCLKVRRLCLCGELPTLPSRFHVLILQHPQEPDKELGSARLAHLSLPNSTLKVGLSWPNLKAALGGEAQPRRWAVLYLGGGIQGETPVRAGGRKRPILHFVDKKGAIQTIPVGPDDLDGIVVLDGTWSQAKTLWWRNPWLLKLRRSILETPHRSLYRELRREPRRECLSTLESIAEGLTALGEPPEIGTELKKLFAKLLDRNRDARESDGSAKD